MDPSERALEARKAWARMINAKATTDDLARAVGQFIGAAILLHDQMLVTGKSWARWIGGRR